MLFHSLFFCILTINICFTIVDLMIRKTSLNVNSAKYIAQRSTLTVCFTLAWMWLIDGFKIPIDPKTMLQMVGCALICGIGLFSFIEATKHLAFTNLLLIQSLGPIIQQVIGKYLFNEPSKWSLQVSFIIAIIGILIQSKIPKNTRGLGLALISVFFWTLGYSLMSIPLKKTEMVWSVLIVEGTILSIAIIGLLIRKNTKDFIQSPIPKMIVFIAGITVIGSYMLNYTYKHFQITNIAWLNLIFLPITVSASQLIFKEKISKLEIISNVIIFIAFAFYQLVG
ncbi:MAG: EamA family transporter [Sphingobacteriaceae bacterium]|jgi:drug/metabolite transporter (DMT)-like permease